MIIIILALLTTTACGVIQDGTPSTKLTDNRPTNQKSITFFRMPDRGYCDFTLKPYEKYLAVFILSPELGDMACYATDGTLIDLTSMEQGEVTSKRRVFCYGEARQNFKIERHSI